MKAEGAGDAVSAHRTTRSRHCALQAPGGSGEAHLRAARCPARASTSLTDGDVREGATTFAGGRHRP